MAKKISKKYPDKLSLDCSNYQHWIKSIYIESITLNKTLEFNELMLFIRALNEEMYDYNITILCNYIDQAYCDENYQFLGLVKMYNDPTLISYLDRNLIKEN